MLICPEVLTLLHEEMCLHASRTSSTQVSFIRFRYVLIIVQKCNHPFLGISNRLSKMMFLCHSLQVENSTNGPKVGTVRIFLAPKFDERGVNMLFRDQRLLFVELDKFTVTCKLGSVLVSVPITERWFELM